MKLLIFLLSFCLFMELSAQDGVGIGINKPDDSAILHVDAPSANKGMLVPRLTTTERDNIIEPAHGLIIFNETTQAFNYCHVVGLDTTWVQLILTPSTFDLDMGGNTIANLANGTTAGDAVNKSQLDTKLDLVGGTMTGAINLGGNKVTNLGNGTADADAINKSQLDAITPVLIGYANPNNASVVYTYQRSGWEIVNKTAAFVQQWEVRKNGVATPVIVSLTVMFSGSVGGGSIPGASIREDRYTIDSGGHRFHFIVYEE